MPLNKREIADLLQKEEIVYIATTKVDGTPHIAPIWFVFHEGKIYFETDKTTVKFGNIKRKNKVKWFEEKDAPIPFRKILWDKYREDMDDSFITENTYIFEVVPEKEISWHYADQDWE